MASILYQATPRSANASVPHAPAQAEQAARDMARAKKVAATKVDFFTLVRGED